MKRSLIIVGILILAAGTSMAAIIFEGFENQTFPPSGWSLSGTATLWSRYKRCSAYGIGTAAAMADFYSVESGYQDLNSFSCTPTSTGDSLRFDHAYAAYSASYIDSLTIWTSTNGGSNWTKLIGLIGGPTGPLNTGGTTTNMFIPSAGQWATKKYALPDNTNLVKFRAHTAFGNNLYIDNIRVFPQQHDVGIKLIVSPERFQTTISTPVIAVTNYGNNAESFTAKCRIDSAGIVIYDETQSVSDLAAGDETSMLFSNWTPVIGEIYNVTAWIELPGDLVSSNDTLTKEVRSYISPRNVMGELFTSTTCTPCVSANGSLNSLYATWKDSVAIVRYHMNWPSPGNDPFYAANVSENNARRTYYGVNVVPDLFLDGDLWGSGSTTYFNNALATHRAMPAPVTMNLGGYYDSVANTGLVRATLTATGKLPDTNLRLRYAVVQDTVAYTGTNGDPVHHQVMRDMVPDANGITIVLNKGETVADSQSFTFNPSWPYVTERRHHIVAFLQGDNTKEIFQSARISFLSLITGVSGGPISVEQVKTLLLPATPNPTGGRTMISYQLAKSGRVSLGVYDVAGRLVRTLENGVREAGRHAASWDGRDNTGKAVANGVYFYRLSAGDFTATRKLTIVR